MEVIKGFAVLVVTVTEHEVKQQNFSYHKNEERKSKRPIEHRIVRFTVQRG